MPIYANWGWLCQFCRLGTWIVLKKHQSTNLRLAHNLVVAPFASCCQSLAGTGFAGGIGHSDKWKLDRKWDIRTWYNMNATWTQHESLICGGGPLHCRLQQLDQRSPGSPEPANSTMSFLTGRKDFTFPAFLQSKQCPALPCKTLHGCKISPLLHKVYLFSQSLPSCNLESLKNRLGSRYKLHLFSPDMDKQRVLALSPEVWNLSPEPPSQSFTGLESIQTD